MGRKKREAHREEDGMPFSCFLTWKPRKAAGGSRSCRVSPKSLTLEVDFKRASCGSKNTEATSHLGMEEFPVV